MKKFIPLLFLSFVFLSFPLAALQPLVPCELNGTKKGKGKIALCMMFQDEAPFLQEWISYHKALGIDYFYLYDNSSSDNFLEIVLPYVQRGEAELYHFFEKSGHVVEHNQLQIKAYNHALKKARNHFTWIAPIDADEFICIPGGEGIKKFLRYNSSASGIALNWLMYGSSGVEILKPKELQIEKFVRRAPYDWGENYFVKTISKVKNTSKLDIHTASYKKGYAILANKQPFSLHKPFDKSAVQQARINHYWWRSEDYFNRVKLLRRRSWQTNYTEWEIDQRRQILNTVYDNAMKKMVRRVKRQIKKDLQKKSF